ncbi:MAG: type II toxin-antitoxin system VapC family toxin [Candidatus Hydrogenedentes bacterium]|nr:type II toxin-antitoxin system VapC family toxin [Candidatus Hydrogenedentota bacterium]
MKPTVYIETSVISYLTSRPSRDLIAAARQEVTQRWWVDSAQAFELVTSEIVTLEASRGDLNAAQQRIAALSGCKLLDVSEAARLLARAILDDGILPTNSGADALHIAVASIHRAEFLLTWNYRHIANATLRKRMNSIIERSGYECPVICSPEELMEH